MTLQEFKKAADEIAKLYLQEFDCVNVVAIISDKTYYIIDFWDSSKRKYVGAKKHNPEDTLEEFKSNLENHFKPYSNHQSDIEL